MERKTRPIDAAPVGITISDPSQPDNPIIYANQRFEDITGYSTAAITGQNCRVLQGPGTDPEQVSTVREAISEREPVNVELTNYRKDGTPFVNRLTIAPVADDAGELANFVGFQEKIDE